MAKFECKVCGYIYNEQQAGRPFDELTECPICNEDKSNFKMLEEEEVFFEWADEDDETIIDAQVRAIDETPIEDSDSELMQAQVAEEVDYLDEEDSETVESKVEVIDTVVQEQAVQEAVEEVAEEDKIINDPSALMKDLSHDTDINTEYVVERRQEFWSPLGSKSEKKEEPAPRKTWSIENAYASVERVLDLNGNEVKPEVKEETSFSDNGVQPVGETPAEEPEFKPLWENGANDVPRVDDQVEAKAENVYRVEEVAEEAEEEPVTEEVAEETEEKSVTEEVAEETEEEPVTEEVAEETGEEPVTEEAAEETGEEPVTEEVAEETEEEPATEEVAEEAEEEPVTEEVAEEAEEEPATEEVAEEAEEEPATEEVAEEAEEEPVTEEVAEEAEEEPVTEEVTEETEEDVVAEEAVEESEEAPIEENEESDVEQKENFVFVASPEAVEKLALNQEYFEDIVTELPEDELVIIPDGTEPLPQQPEEVVEELVEEVAEEAESEDFNFGDLDDVEETSEVEEILIEESEENKWTFNNSMSNTWRGQEENAKRYEFIAKELGENVVAEPKAEVAEVAETAKPEETVEIKTEEQGTVNESVEEIVESVEEDIETEVPVVKEPVEVRYSNGLENIMILPAQLSPMPLDERAVIETKVVVGLSAERPMHLEKPVIAYNCKKVVEYAPNRGLTSDDFQAADVIEIIVGRGEGIEKTISSKEDLRQAVAFLRLESDGCPVGIKLAAGRIERDLEFCVFAKPDFVVLNNFNVVPLAYALHRACMYLNTVQSDMNVVIELEDIADAEEAAKILAMGADVIVLKNTCKDIDGVNEELKRISKETGHYEVRDLNVKDLCTTDRDIAQYTDISHV